jgi:hypothetical protein
MSYWDSSALIKLYVQGFDSAAFRSLAANATWVVTALICTCAGVPRCAAYLFCL